MMNWRLVSCCIISSVSSLVQNASNERPSVAITAAAGAEIEIYDIRGNVVAIPSLSVSLPRERDDQSVDGSPSPLGEGFRMRGFTWQPDKSIASGIYLIRATMGDETRTKRVVYLK